MAAELTRHYAMVTTPKKRSRRSLLASSTSGKVAVMTEYKEVDLKDVPLNTPPGKESEVIATVTVGNEELMRTVLDKLEVLQTTVASQNVRLEAQNVRLEAQERLSTTTRAVILRFIADYVYEVCQFGYGRNFSKALDKIIESGSPKEVALKHTLESIPTKKLTITRDIALALKRAKPFTGKLSEGYCHCGTLKGVAECLTSEETARIAKDEDLHACRVLAELIFGPLQSIIDSDDPELYKEFTVPRYVDNGKWKKK